MTAINTQTQQLLAEAAIYARPSNHPGDLDTMFDCGDGSDGPMDVDEAIERPSSDEEDEGNDIDTPIASHDGHAAARTHVIAWYVYRFQLLCLY